MKTKTTFEVYTEHGYLEVSVHHDLDADDSFKFSICDSSTGEYKYLDRNGVTELRRDLLLALREAES